MGYRVFVGNLPMDIKEKELDDLFYKYGKIKEIEIKNPPRPPAFAFITYDDEDDANDAVKGRDGYEFDGSRLRVEMAKGGRGGAERNRDRRDNRGRTGGRRTEWRVLVTNLPKSTSWQDLKDFMRKAGDVIYANVDEYGDGVVDYGNEDDMEYAIRKLDDVEFKNSHDSSYIRVRADRGRDRRHSSSSDRHRRSRSRDRSDSRDRRRHRDSRDDRKRSPSQNSESEKKRDDPEPKEKKERNGSSRDDSTRRRGSSSGSEREQRRSRRSPSSSSSRER